MGVFNRIAGGAGHTTEGAVSRAERSTVTEGAGRAVRPAGQHAAPPASVSGDVDALTGTRPSLSTGGEIPLTKFEKGIQKGLPVAGSVHPNSPVGRAMSFRDQVAQYDKNLDRYPKSPEIEAQFKKDAPAHIQAVETAARQANNPDTAQQYRNLALQLRNTIRYLD